MHIKFIHTADLHLDTPFKGLGQWNPELARQLRDATYNSFFRITELAISEKVDFVLIAGDIFDNENQSLAAQLRFADGLKRLSSAGISAYFICGNHDYYGSWDPDASLPRGVYRFGADQPGKFTYSRNGVAVADIYGISYGAAQVSDNLALLLQKTGSPAPFSIAMLHGMADVVGRDNRYSPFGIKELIERGFDYWALGHVHTRRILHEDPPVVYPGNPQGRDFGENGEKGCYLVEMETGKNPSLKFMPVCSIRLEEVLIDLTGEDDIVKLTERLDEKISRLAAEGRERGLLIRVLLGGRTNLHRKLNTKGELERLTDELNSRYAGGGNLMWIDSIRSATRPVADTVSIGGQGDFASALADTFARFENDSGLLSELTERLIDELPASRIFREIEMPSRLEMNEILEKAKWMLLDRLDERE